MLRRDRFASGNPPYAHGWLSKYTQKGDEKSHFSKFQKRFVLLRDGKFSYYTEDQSLSLNGLSQVSVQPYATTTTTTTTPHHTHTDSISHMHGSTLAV